MSKRMALLNVKSDGRDVDHERADALRGTIDAAVPTQDRWILREFSYLRGESRECLTDVARHVLEVTGIGAGLPSLGRDDPERDFSDWFGGLRYGDPSDEPDLQVVLFGGRPLRVMLVVPTGVDVEAACAAAGAAFEVDGAEVEEIRSPSP